MYHKSDVNVLYVVLVPFVDVESIIIIRSICRVLLSFVVNIYIEFVMWLCFRFDLYDSLNCSIVFKHALKSNGIFIAIAASRCLWIHSPTLCVLVAIYEFVHFTYILRANECNLEIDGKWLNSTIMERLCFVSYWVCSQLGTILVVLVWCQSVAALILHLVLCRHIGWTPKVDASERVRMNNDCFPPWFNIKIIIYPLLLLV